METIENIALAYKEGRSDKAYNVQLQSTGVGYVVNFQYGRRGTSLQSGSKTSSPIPLDKARKIYDALVASKMAKGYSPGEGGTTAPSGTPFAGTEKAQRISGYLPQLLNPIDESTLERLLDNDIHVGQVKHDGVHMLLLIEDGVVRAINRKGLFVETSSAITEGARHLEGQYILDGEAIGDHFYAFDILRFGAIETTKEPYFKRLEYLISVIELTDYQLTPTAVTAAEKRQLYADLVAMNAEGIVFKDPARPYTVGRPNSGGPALKYKFYKTASVRIAKINDKRSIAMELLDPDGAPVGVGNCTIPANVDLAALAPGDVVEIRYLYAYKGGSLYQPVFLGQGRRLDIDPEECTLDQLIFKADPA